MVKKTIIAIAAIVVIAAIFASAARIIWNNPYYSNYSPYAYQYPYLSSPYSYSYTPYYSYPYYASSYYYPSYISPYYNYPYYGPLSSEYMYRYGGPTTSYPYSPTTNYPASTTERGVQGQPCGIIYSQQYGCEYGMVCDYSKSGISGVGVCTTQSLPESSVSPYVGP